MKKITQLSFFVVLTLSFLGIKVDAQSYDIRWYDRIGPNNVTIVADYSDFDLPTMRRRVLKNNGPYYLPNWQPIQEDVLSGAGVDTLSFPFGGNFLVQILDGQNGNALLLSVLVTPIQNAISVIPEPTINVHDVIYGTPPYISLMAQVVSSYGLGRPSYYRTKLYCTIVRTSPNDYVSTVEWAMPLGSPPQAFFNLPFQWFGDYCFRWFITDEDTSIDSHFDETEVWTSETLCFSYGSTGFQSDRLKFEPGLLSYPNPFTDVVTIESPSTTDYVITNLAGQTVASGQLFAGKNQLGALSGLSSGVYVMTTDIGKTKLVKQ